MKVISKRLYTAQRFFHEKDYETALIFIAIAIDGTAKKKWPSLNTPGKVGERIKKFVTEYHDFIIQLASNGAAVGFDGKRGRLIFSGQEFPDLAYAVRNALIHADELENNIHIIHPSNCIMGKDIINYNHIHGLYFSVIMDSVNCNEKFEKNLNWKINGKTFFLNDLWGDRDKVENLFNIKK